VTTKQPERKEHSKIKHRYTDEGQRSKVMGYIYLTMNTLNDKIYIGRHNSKDSSYLGSGTYFRNAVKKYGRENFRKVILESNINDNDLINEREMYWINFFNSTNRVIGYNITKGGGGVLGYIPTPETILKLSGENHPGYGKHYSQERKSKISQALKGRYMGKFSPLYGKGENRRGELNPFYGKKHTQETRDKMSESRKGELAHRYGKYHTQETREKMSKAHIAHWQKRKERELKPNG